MLATERRLLAIRDWGRAKGVVMPPPLLLGLAVFAGLLAVTPLAYIVIRAIGASPDTWGRLWSGRIPGLLTNTLLLVACTATFTATLGLGLAWLVERTDLPGRGFWRWVLALPLAVPAYVGALCYLIVLRRGGLLEQALVQWGGLQSGQVSLPSLYTLWAATIIVGLFTFPYVYLPVSAALRSTNWSLEEAARVGGQSAWGAFRRVVLPLLRPALLAGTLLVCLYALSDFGTVALLQYRTFTVAIYNQFAGSVDRSGAAILSVVLVLLSTPLLFLEAWSHRRSRRYVAQASWKPRRLVTLGRWRWVAAGGVSIVGMLSLGLPLLVLGGLTLQGWLWPTPVDRIWSVGGDDLWRYGLNSLLLAGLAASIAILLAFAPAYLASRYPHRLVLALLAAGKSGYSLPGIIVGLSLVLLFSNWVPVLYGTVAVLVLAFGIRFLPQALASTEAAMKAASPKMEQAARTMGRKPWQVFREITLPMIAPGLAAGWALVFLTSMKELPTAILLRPPGFDTLPVRIWAASSESIYTQAAPPAFLLISLTVLAMALLFTRGKFGTDEVVL
ncbi:MAG TPA: iron ABC transporter permease [Chloroflexia bacterium]|jgi:iron(III) transport system permease protein